MEFELLGQTIKFQGNPHMTDMAISGSRLRKLVARQKVAYFCQLMCESPDPRYR